MAQPMSRPTLSFKIGDQPVPGYRLVRELGRGTFGVVWLAVTDNGFERALKVVNLEQRGGKKEFRALRLIKDRKILHGNLLMLVDYWLLDREGTILNLANDPGLESQLAPSKPGTSVGSQVKTDTGSQVQVTNLAALQKGTMLPGGDGSDSSPQSVRDTFQQAAIRDTKEDESSNAIWLVVAMELGHKTLHDRQKEHTAEVRAKQPSKLVRKGATEVDFKGDTAPGSNTVADGRAQQADDVEDDLLPLPADEILPYMEQAARGLDHLHRCEIVHRDVKPQNIMLVGDVAKVCDYGLASELNDLRATTNAFTLPYAAPEAINKNRPTPASDQYSLAVTYVELRTGRWPFASNTTTAVYTAKDTGVHHLKFVPKRAVRIVLKKALSKNSADRYPTCGDFVKELTKAEHAGSSLFAIVQGALAILAIITVLLAALATHPDIRSKIVEIGEQVGLIPPPVVVKTDPQDFKRRIQEAQAQLATKANATAARKQFEELEKSLDDLPKGEVSARVDLVFGLARAVIGESSTSQTYQPLAEATHKRLGDLMAKLALPAEPALSEEQKIRMHYLQYLNDPKIEVPIAYFDPNSEPAKLALNDWERSLWKSAIEHHTYPEVTRLLQLVITHRQGDSSDDQAKARDAHQELVEVAERIKLDPTHELSHKIELETLHLDHKDNNLTVTKLDDFITKVNEQSSNLVDRARILQLFILSKQKGTSLSLFDEDITQLFAKTPEGMLDEYNIRKQKLSAAEEQEIKRLRAVFRNDVLLRETPLATADSSADYLMVTKVFTQRDCLLILCDRVLEWAKPTNLPAKQAALEAARSDLQKFVLEKYPADSLAGVELQAYSEAMLTSALANPAADAAESLVDYARYVRSAKTETRDVWFEQLLKQAETVSTWTLPAMTPLRDLIKNPPPGWKDNRPRFTNWERRIEALETNAVLNVDPENSTEIEAFLKQSEMSALHDLIQIEMDMLKDKSPTPETIKAWRDRAENAKGMIPPTSGTQVQYAQWMLARLQVLGSGTLSATADTQVRNLYLLPLPPEWLMPSRRRAAADVFSVLAIRSLKLDDLAVLRFSDLPAAQRPELMELRKTTSAWKMESAGLSLVEAIQASTPSTQANWKEVRSQLAQRDPRLDWLFEQNHAGRLIRYVAALSAIRSSGESMPAEPAVISDFAQLLETPAVNRPAFFNFAGGPTEDDENILKNLVNPLLKMSFSEQSLASLKPAEKTQLARIWAAKGRLLQRSPVIVFSDEGNAITSTDRVRMASVVGYDAFSRARKLDDRLEYVVGCGRLSLYLPLSNLAPESLNDLIQKYDPQGTSMDPGMRYLFAQNMRIRGYEERDESKWRPAINGAIDRFEDLVTELEASGDDPWQLLAVTHEGLSDSHLRLAFLTKHVSFEEVRTLRDGGVPKPDTKAFHLHSAVKHAEAQESIKIENRLRPEFASIGLANAYEDFAYYLYLTTYYKKSADAFRKAIKETRDDGRDVCEAQMNFGRCLYRQGIDPFTEKGELTDQLNFFLLAIENLQEAVGPNSSLPPNRKSEALLWLAQNKSMRFRLRGVDEELKASSKLACEYLLGAADDLKAAADISQQLGRHSEQMMYLALQLETVLSLVQAVNDEKRKTPALDLGEALSMASLSGRLASIENVGYDLFRTQAARVPPDYVGKFATQSGHRWVANQWTRDFPLRDRWIDESVRELWKQSPLWRHEEFLVRLQRVRELETKGATSQPQIEGELRLANMLVEGLSPASAKSARSQLLDRAMMAASRDIAQLEAKGVNNNALLEAYRKHLPAMLEARRARDAVIELDRDQPAEKQTNDKAKLIQRINQTKFSGLSALASDLTNLERKALLDELNRLPDLGAAWNLGAACQMIAKNIPANPPANAAPAYTKKELERIALETLKPYYVLPTSIPQMAVYARVRTKHQAALQLIENAGGK